MKIRRASYKDKLRYLQIELTKLQKHIILHRQKVLIIFEGRDASGKDGVIKRITEHLSPRETRVVALGRPSAREQDAWYFQRYVAQLPVGTEMVLFNRSWYNRAGVEKVMGYCSDADYRNFLDTVNDFERLLINSGINLVKYYLDISFDEQEKRLRERKLDPLSQWKISPVDESALDKWDDYSEARDEMFKQTHTQESPWLIVQADNKKTARLNVIRDILSRVHCPERDRHLHPADTAIVSKYKIETTAPTG